MTLNPFSNLTLRGIASVWLRNFLVWRKLLVPSLVFNVAEPLITLVALGYGLGLLVGRVESNGSALPYIVFLASGSVCMSAMNSASFEALFSGYSRLGPQKTWEGILNAPVSLEEIVAAEILWAGFKALFTGAAILLVARLLGLAETAQLLLVWPLLLLVGICFAAMAMVFTVMAKSYDFFNYYLTLFLTPMMFLSGVYFPRSQLPEAIQGAVALLPLSAAVDLIRPIFLGLAPETPLRSVALLLGYALLALALAQHLVRRRFGVT